MHTRTLSHAACDMSVYRPHCMLNNWPYHKLVSASNQWFPLVTIKADQAPGFMGFSFRGSSWCLVMLRRLIRCLT